jgi:hypothetical protein
MASDIATETCFALKGGTAINLFVRDLPRLSVDIDLVYLPIEDRETSLVGISAFKQQKFSLPAIHDATEAGLLIALHQGRIIIRTPLQVFP